MDRLFLYIAPIVTALLLFFPFVFEADLHYDLNRKKLGFSIYLYGFLKVFGGYIATYPGGFAIHRSDKKVILEPYSKLDKERKRFSFMRSFRILSFTLTTETGAEYLLPIGALHSVLRVYFFIIGGKKENIENNLWLTDGDVLRISLRINIYFNLFILLSAFIKFLGEKVKALWKKRKKRSIA